MIYIYIYIYIYDLYDQLTNLRQGDIMVVK